MTRALDTTDLRLIAELRRRPRATAVELAEAVGISRGTVAVRVGRLEGDGVITGYGPDIDATAAGLAVLAFCTLEIQQGSHAPTVAVTSLR